MSERWRTLPFLLLSLLASSLAAPSQSFENTAIVRTVELGGSVVHVTTTYAIKALEAGAKVYTVALGAEEKTKTSWLEVRVKGQQQQLGYKERAFDTDKGHHLIDVTLPKSLAVNSTLNIVIEAIQTHATYAWPAKAAQNEDQALKFEMDLFVLSPYRTSVQRTKLRAPTPRVISFTTPEKLQDFTLDTPVSKSGATVTYGPFNHVPPSANKGFIAQYQQPIVIHYNYDQAVLEVTKLTRVAEISHWGANLNIQDEIHLFNAGPMLKGHFSRLEHQTQSFYKRAAPQVLSALTLHLPAGIRNTYYYDVIGNVSTSRLRLAPSVPKSPEPKQYSVLELKPRYPLMGGWNFTFTLGWDSPLADSGTWDKNTGRYYVEIPLMTAIPGAVVNDANIQVILPEAATDVQFFTPFPAISNEISTHITYLDTTGRPALTFNYKNLTTKQAQNIYVSYKVTGSAHLKKPFAVALAFFSVFALALVGRRIDFTIHKKKVL